MPVRLSEPRLSALRPRIKTEIKLSPLIRGGADPRSAREGSPRRVPAASLPHFFSSILIRPSPHPQPSCLPPTSPRPPRLRVKFPFSAASPQKIPLHQKSLRPLLLCGLESSPKPPPQKIPFASSALFARASLKTKTVPLDKEERARACAGRESSPRSRRIPSALPPPILNHPLPHPYPSC